MTSKYNKITTIKVCDTSDRKKLYYNEYYKDGNWAMRIRIKGCDWDGTDDTEYYYLDKNAITKIKFIKYTNFKNDNVYLKIYHTVPEGLNLLIITLENDYSKGEVYNIKKLHKELSYWSL